MRELRWSRWLHRAFHFHSRRRPCLFRPQVMVLEDRRLLSTAVYDVQGLSCYAGVGLKENAVAGIDGWLNGQNDFTITDYHAQINWGDSSNWFAADIVPNPGSSSGTAARFLVKGSHIYAQAGTYLVVVYG